MRDLYQQAFASALGIDGNAEEITYSPASNPADPARLMAIVARLTPDDDSYGGRVGTRFRVEFLLSDLVGESSGAAYTPARRDRITRADGSVLVVDELADVWGVASLVCDEDGRPRI